MLAHLRSNAVAYVALFIALGGTSFAAVSKLTAADGTISGCVAKTGAVRVVSPTAKCKRGETALSWNSHGTAGAAGPAGAQGAAGAQGPAGAKGEQGQAGTVDTSQFFTKSQSDARFLAAGGQAADALKLGGLPSSSYLQGAGVYRHLTPANETLVGTLNDETTLASFNGVAIKGFCQGAASGRGATVELINTNAGSFDGYLDLQNSTQSFSATQNTVLRSGNIAADAAASTRFVGPFFDVTVYYHSSTSGQNTTCAWDGVGFFPS